MVYVNTLLLMYVFIIKKKNWNKKCFWFTQNEAIKYKNVKTENESIIWLLFEDASKINVKRE